MPAQLRSLGATRWQLAWLLLREARLPLVAAAMAAGGRLLAEVGAAMMVGGNIKGETRIL
ncbi:MAG TPA: tungstate transporter permease, partial [Myxococcales bacterium]|nr:tungstate transporter permease [Myxococcales bacterium]